MNEFVLVQHSVELAPACRPRHYLGRAAIVLGGLGSLGWAMFLDAFSDDRHLVVSSGIVGEEGRKITVVKVRITRAA